MLYESLFQLVNAEILCYLYTNIGGFPVFISVFHQLFVSALPIVLAVVIFSANSVISTEWVLLGLVTDPCIY